MKLRSKHRGEAECAWNSTARTPSVMELEYLETKGNQELITAFASFAEAEDVAIYNFSLLSSQERQRRLSISVYGIVY